MKKIALILSQFRQNLRDYYKNTTLSPKIMIMMLIYLTILAIVLMTATVVLTVAITVEMKIKD